MQPGPLPKTRRGLSFKEDIHKEVMLGKRLLAKHFSAEFMALPISPLASARGDQAIILKRFNRLKGWTPILVVWVKPR